MKAKPSSESFYLFIYFARLSFLRTLTWALFAFRCRQCHAALGGLVPPLIEKTKTLLSAHIADTKAHSAVNNNAGRHNEASQRTCYFTPIVTRVR